MASYEKEQFRFPDLVPSDWRTSAVRTSKVVTQSYALKQLVGKTQCVKKWWIARSCIFGIVVTVVVWGLWPKSQNVRIVIHEPTFVVYDVWYYPLTNKVHYWRCAWRDALGLFGLMKARAQSMASEHGPALVVYHSRRGNSPGAPFLTGDKSNPVGDHSSTEFFGDRCVTKCFFETLTNGEYHLKEFQGLNRGGTNLADVYINFNEKSSTRREETR